MKGKRAKQLRRLASDIYRNNPATEFTYRRLKKQYTRNPTSLLWLLKDRERRQKAAKG